MVIYWVILLACRPNFAIVPKCLPNWEYIMAVEHVYSKLNQEEADELRIEVKNVLERPQLPRTNIQREDMKAMKELREDNIRMILTADSSGDG